MHLSIPFATQNGAGPKLGGLPAPCNGTLTSLLRGLRAIEQALALSIEVAPMIRLQAIGQDAEQEMTRQVKRCRSSADRMPPAANPSDVEIAQPRDLGVAL